MKGENSSSFSIFKKKKSKSWNIRNGLRINSTKKVLTNTRIVWILRDKENIIIGKTGRKTLYTVGEEDVINGKETPYSKEERVYKMYNK